MSYFRVVVPFCLFSCIISSAHAVVSKPWCVNGSELVKGEWIPNLVQQENDWTLFNDARAPACSMSTLHGEAVLKALSNTHILFLGDSILRQVYVGLVQGVIRNMPVVVDTSMFLSTSSTCVAVVKECQLQCFFLVFFFTLRFMR
jgi:hypothetical protein